MHTMKSRYWATLLHKVFLCQWIPYARPTSSGSQNICSGDDLLVNVQSYFAVLGLPCADPNEDYSVEFCSTPCAGAPTVAEFKGKQLLHHNAKILDLIPCTTYTFRLCESNSALSGFALASTLPVPPNPPTKVGLRTKTAHSLTFKWSLPYLGDNLCLPSHYRVDCEIGDHGNVTVVKRSVRAKAGQSDFRSSLRHLQPGARYRCAVVSYNDEGESFALKWYFKTL